MISLQSKVESYKLSLPQSPKEIPAQYFEDVTNCINLAKHYAIIAIVRQIRFYDFTITLSNPKAKVRASDIAILAKINSSDTPDTFAIGQQVVIDEAAVARGNQIVVPSALSYENVVSYFVREEQYITQSKDENVRKLKTLVSEVMNGNIKDDKGVSIKDYPICFISFKIVPVTDLHATVDSQISFRDPFVEPIHEHNGEDDLTQDKKTEEVKE